MLIFPDIDDIKFKIPPKTKRERLYSSIYPINFQKELKQINNLFSIIPMPPTKITLKTKSCKKSKEKNGVNKFFSVITPDSEKINLDKDLKNDINTINNLELLKIENEIIPKTIEFNKTSRNKRSFFSNKANYKRNLVNIFSNKLIDIDKFIEEINSFLLPNDKTFENIQNLINDKIKMNKNTLKNDVFNHLLKSKEIPITTFNYELIFRYIFNNTFKESFKKALLNKTLITKKEIKEEYQKQINNIKQYLNLHNQERKDLRNNLNFESLIINNNSSPFVTNINNNKLTYLGRNERNRKIILSNSLDNIFSNLNNYNKELFDSKYYNIDWEKKKLDKQNSLIFPPDNETLHKENTENSIESIVFKRKMDILREKRLKDIIKKKKSIIDDFIKLKEIINNDEENLIKTENSVQKNIKKFVFLSCQKPSNKNDNKNGDILNCINNNEKTVKFENSLIKERINKFFIQENKLNEKNDFNINSLNGIENKKSNIIGNNIETELKIKELDSKNGISFLKNSFSQRALFAKNIIIGKNLFNNNEKDDTLQYKKQIKDNYSKLFNDDNEPIKWDEEIKKAIDNKKRKIILKKNLFLKKKGALNVGSFKDFLNEGYYEYKMEELNNKFEEKTIFENDLNTERLMEKNIDEKEEKLLEENLEYQLNNFKNNIKRLKNMSKDEFIKDTLKFIKSSE